MIATEHEMTVATDAAARAYFEESTRHLEPRPAFDDLKPMEKWQVRQHVMPLAVAAIQAIPDRRADAWDLGNAAAEDNPLAANPYREDQS